MSQSVSSFKMSYLTYNTEEKCVKLIATITPEPDAVTDSNGTVYIEAGEKISQIHLECKSEDGQLVTEESGRTLSLRFQFLSYNVPSAVKQNFRRVKKRAPPPKLEKSIISPPALGKEKGTISMKVPKDQFYLLIL